MNTKPSFRLLSGNQLKIIALIAMTLDHIGFQLLPQYPILRIFGRLAFPIFAWFIAEGCRYTRNRKKYLLTMAALAAICQLVYFFALGSLYQCVLVTFTLAILWICALDGALAQNTVSAWLLTALVSVGIVFLSVGLPRLLPGTDYAIDYGFWGILLPVLVYVPTDRNRKLAVAALVLLSLCIAIGSLQWFSLLALIPLALYNGERGRHNIKNLFYIYYPAHLVVLYVLSLIPAYY